MFSIFSYHPFNLPKVGRNILFFIPECGNLFSLVWDRLTRDLPILVIDFLYFSVFYLIDFPSDLCEYLTFGFLGYFSFSNKGIYIWPIRSSKGKNTSLFRAADEKGALSFQITPLCTSWNLGRRMKTFGTLNVSS